MSKVVIVGGGISGLTIAYHLQKIAPAIEVRVLEQSNRLGGNVWTRREEGYQIECGPNGFLDTKASTLSLCSELGLTDRLIAASDQAGKNRYLALDEKLERFPTRLSDFFRSSLLSWRGKARLAAELFCRCRKFADESVHDFIQRRAGREAAEVFGDALVTGIYAGDSALLSLPACFPRLRDLERHYGSVIRGMSRSRAPRSAGASSSREKSTARGRMWSFREGMELLIDSIAEHIAGKTYCGVAVRRIERHESQVLRPAWTVAADGKDSWKADAVVLACPAHVQAAVIAELDLELAERIGGIAYSAVAVVGLGYAGTDVPIDLNGFGFIVPQRTRRDLLGVQWCSSIFSERAPPGAVLLRAMCGGWHRPEIAGWEDDRLLAALRLELKRLMGIDAVPRHVTIIRWDRAIPQYHMGHLDRVAWIEERAARHPGLFLAGNAYHGVALNDCTERGLIDARRVKKYVESMDGNADGG